MKSRISKVMAGPQSRSSPSAVRRPQAVDTTSGASTTNNNGSASAHSDGALPRRSEETVLTGDTASKVTAAAEAEVPGATIERVETDADDTPPTRRTW